MAPSSSGLGYRPLTPKTRVRVPLGLFRRLSSPFAALVQYVRRISTRVAEYFRSRRVNRKGLSGGTGRPREPVTEPASQPPLQLPDDVKAQAIATGGVSYRAPSGQAYVVIYHDGQLRVFVNRCPHRQLRLDRGGRVLRSEDRQWIVCGVHGERFDPLTGKCVSARCAGKYLQAAAHVVTPP